MQPHPSPVAPAIMGPLASKSSSVRNDKFLPTRGRFPSEKSSTSSLSKRNTCFVCTTSSAYDLTKLINCSACKRRFHRGCHKPPVAQNSPSDWTCYMCAPPKGMPPAVKKRKLGRSVFAPGADDTSRMSLDGKEIPESPQEQPNTANNTASKPNAFAQPPRFAPFTTDAGKRGSIVSIGSTRQIQPPRFAASAVEAKEQSTVRTTISDLKGESRVGKHSSQSSDPSVIISKEASRMLTATPAISNNQAKKPSYHEVIGMALHEAPDCCLSREGIQKWIVGNVPSYDSKDASWERGVWVTLSHSDDFVYLKDKAKTGLWTFSDGSSNKYRKSQKPVNKFSSGSSSQDVTEIQERTKQRDDAIGRNAEALAPDHEIDDLRSPETQSDQIACKENTRARSNTNSALPSTIDETLEMIDLTMDDDDETLPSRSNPLELERSTAENNGISLSQALERISSASFKDRQSLKRSSSVAFGQPVWGSRTSVSPKLMRPTPFTDSIVKKASEEMKEDIRCGEKWKAAVEKMGASLKSPMKAKFDSVRESLTKSPINSPKPTWSVSQPLASPKTQDAQLNLDSPNLSHESQLHGLGTGVQNDVLLHSDLSPPDIARGPTVATDISVESDAETADQVVHMDVDLPEDSHEPELIEPEPGVPRSETLVSAETESDEATQSGARQEAFPEKPISQEPLAEEPPAPKLSLEEPPRRTYADSAAQTSLPVTSAFTLGKITQISLEPRVPAVVAPASVCATANSTTQTESLPGPQTAPPILSPAPTVQLLTPQAEPIESQPPQDNGHDPDADFEKDCLALLDEMMYPTKTSTPDWPSHFTSLPDPFTTPSVPLSTIRARPTRKQIFGKNELSRIENNNALTRLNKIKLGMQNVGQIELGKGYTEEERKREIEANEKDGHYDTLEELFNMPQQVVPFIHEQQLAFRDYAPNALGRIGRPRVIYKIGANAK